MSELSLIKHGGGGARIYTEADCTLTADGIFSLVLPSGVTWGDITDMIVQGSYPGNWGTAQFFLVKTTAGGLQQTTSQGGNAYTTPAATATTVTVSVPVSPLNMQSYRATIIA